MSKRGLALPGYLAVFPTILSPDIKQVYRILGRPFVKAHHVVPIATFIQKWLQRRGR